MGPGMRPGLGVFIFVCFSERHQKEARRFIYALPSGLAGRYACVVCLRGEEVHGSPFGVTVRAGAVDPTASGVAEEDYAPSGVLESYAGQEGRLRLILRDACGNQLDTGGARLAVQLRCPVNGLAQRAAIADQGDGSYLVRIRPEVACIHELHAWLLWRAPHDEMNGR